MRALGIVAASFFFAGCSLIDLSSLSGDDVGGNLPTGGATSTTGNAGGSGATGGNTSVTATAGGTGGMGGDVSSSSSTSTGCVDFCDSASGSAYCDSFETLIEWTPTNGVGAMATSMITMADFTSCPSALAMSIAAAQANTYAQLKHPMGGVPSKVDITFSAKIVTAADTVTFFETAWATPNWYCQTIITRNASGMFGAVQALDINNNYAGTQLGTVFITGPRATNWTNFNVDIDLNVRDFKLTVDGMSQSTSLMNHPCLSAPDDDSVGIFFGTVFDKAPSELLYDDLLAKID